MGMRSIDWYDGKAPEMQYDELFKGKFVTSSDSQPRYNLIRFAINTDFNDEPLCRDKRLVTPTPHVVSPEKRPYPLKKVHFKPVEGDYPSTVADISMQFLLELETIKNLPKDVKQGALFAVKAVQHIFPSLTDAAYAIEGSRQLDVSLNSVIEDLKVIAGSNIQSAVASVVIDSMPRKSYLPTQDYPIVFYRNYRMGSSEGTIIRLLDDDASTVSAREIRKQQLNTLTNLFISDVAAEYLPKMESEQAVNVVRYFFSTETGKENVVKAVRDFSTALTASGLFKD